MPEAIEDFFVAAAPISGITPKPVQRGARAYRIGKIPEGETVPR